MDHDLPMVKKRAQLFLSQAKVVNPNGRICENQFSRTLVFARPAAWNTLQLGHGAPQGRQPASAFPLNEGLQRFTKQSRFLRYAGELLSGAYEVVVERNSCSHRQKTSGTNYSIK